MTDKRRIVAHHEAAHAVADYRFGFTTAGVTIGANQENGSIERASHFDAWLGLEAPGPDMCREVAIGCLAGFAAELRLAPDRRPAAIPVTRPDLENTAEFLRVMGEMDMAASDDAIPGHWIEEATTFVNRDWRAISCVAEALMELEHLCPEEVEYLIHIADGDPAAAEDLRTWCAYQYDGLPHEAEARYRALVTATGMDAGFDSADANRRAEPTLPSSLQDRFNAIKAALGDLLELADEFELSGCDDDEVAGILERTGIEHRQWRELVSLLRTYQDTDLPS